MNKKIIVTGSLAFDTIMNFKGKFSDHILPDKIHTLNLSFLVDEMQKTRGGTAGNITYNLGLLKSAPILLSTFGKDGEEYREFLKDHGVDVSYTPLSEKLYTSQSLVLTDSADNQITSFYAGSMVENENLSVLSVIASERSERGNLLKNDKIASSPSPKLVRDSRNDNKFVVISPNTPAAMRCFVQECTQHDIHYMYDPGMQLPRISDEDLKRGIENCEILIGNDYEVELMRRRVGNIQTPILITTLGEKGAVIFDNRKSGGPSVVALPQDDNFTRQYIINPAVARKIVDPTGAGDAFRAGFLAGYIKDFDLKTCGQMGATCAVYTVEKYGTTTHEFSVDMFCKRYEENYGVKLAL